MFGTGDLERGHEADAAQGQLDALHTIKQEMKRHAAIEPIIGHLKAEHRMARNYLKAPDGDLANAIPAAAGFNFHLLLKWFAALLCAFFQLITAGRQALSMHELLRQQVLLGRPSPLSGVCPISMITSAQDSARSSRAHATRATKSSTSSPVRPLIPCTWQEMIARWPTPYFGSRMKRPNVSNWFYARYLTEDLRTMKRGFGTPPNWVKN